MKNTGFCIFLLLFLYSYTATAQSACDCSASKAVNARYDYFVSVWQLDSCEALLSPLNNKKCAVYYNFLSADLSHKRNNIYKMKGYLDTGFVLLEQHKCSTELFMKYYFLYGLLNVEEGRTDKSSGYFIKCMEIAEQLRDTLYYNASIANLSAVLREMKQHERALFYLKKAEHSATGGNNTWVLSGVYAGITESYIELFKRSNKKAYLDSAAVTIQKAVSYSREAGNMYGVYFSYMLLADFQALNGKYKMANMYCDSILSAMPRPMRDMLSTAFLKKSENYFQLNQLDSSRRCADSALVYADEISYQADVHQQLYKVYRKTGMIEQALEEYEKMSVLRDSVLSVERTKAINDIEQKYNRAKNEQTIRELSQEKEISGLRITLLSALIVVAILMLLILFFYFRQKQLRNQHQLLEAQQRLNQARMNPHFFFNTLSSLQTLALTEKTSTRLADYLSKYARIMRQTLESSYHEYIVIEEELSFLQHYMELQSLRFPDKFSYEINVDEDIDVSEQMIPPMLIQPFIENSIEHGFREIGYKGLIKIHFQLKKKNIQILVEDNGTLVSGSSKQYPSRATEIVRDRLYLLNEKHRRKASFTCNPVQPRGYKVLIIIPDSSK